MTLSPQIAALFVLTTGVGWMMMVLGVWKRTLDWTRRPSVCPGCGRELRRGRCGCES
jgi:hypothetical protein